jgi:hypothetical protein
MGHWRAQWPFLPHLKQAPGGADGRFWVFSLTRGCGPAGRRAVTKAWVWRATFCWRYFWRVDSAASFQALKTLNAIFIRSCIGV